MSEELPVYLDHAAATPLDPEVAAVMAEVQATTFANPSSPHASGRAARRVLEESRERILAAFGGRGSGPERDTLVFTSGASEANHLAIVGRAGGLGSPGDVLWSRRDHASARHAVELLRGRGWQGHEVPLDPRSGTAAAAAGAILSHRLPGRPCLVSLTLACGQTGSIEPLGCAVSSAAAVGDMPRVHLDATQAAGFLELDVQALPVATLCLAPHKFGGPRGIGGLLIRSGVRIDPPRPGVQERGLRGGTEPVVLAAGFARAVEIVARDRTARNQRMAALRDRLETAVLAAAAAVGFEPLVIAAAADRAPHISAIAFPGVDRQAFVMAADLAGVCLATGTACSSGASEPAPAIAALGIPPAVAESVVRLSVGCTTTSADVDLAVERLAGVLAVLSGPGRKA
ncbi:MAG: cysteine desulfurase family protein [Planctomycetia bacterium]